MSKKTKLNTLTAALGTTFVVSALSSIPIASAAENPFAMNEISHGYMVAAHAEGKCGEGKCGGKKETEGKCGGKHSDKKEAEGKCGEGKCGGK